MLAGAKWYSRGSVREKRKDPWSLSEIILLLIAGVAGILLARLLLFK